jgi:hypothetical protein
MFVHINIVVGNKFFKDKIMNKTEFVKSYMSKLDIRQEVNFQLLIDIVCEYEKLTSDNSDYEVAGHTPSPKLSTNVLSQVLNDYDITDAIKSYILADPRVSG